MSLKFEYFRQNSQKGTFAIFRSFHSKELISFNVHGFVIVNHICTYK